MWVASTVTDSRAHVVDYADSPFDGQKLMRDVPVQIPDARREASADEEAGTVISVTRNETRGSPSIPPPPVWGGMASPRSPARDFRGPFLFVAALVGVALTAVGLLIYAVSMERGPRLDAYDLEAQTTGMAGGGELANGGTASVWVDGAPYGATLRVNTDSVGTLPMTVENLEAGEHLLTLEAGDRALDTLISVRAGETAAVFIRLDELGDVSEAILDVEAPIEAAPLAPEPSPQATVPSAPATGTLRIVSTPAGAAVRVDGAPVGTTPLVMPDVEAGSHSISATLAGHQPRETRVEVAAGRDQMVRLSLEAVAGPGTLEILARPWGTIYIDGALHKRNTDVVYRAQLPAGTHEIRVIHPTFGERTRQVVVGAGQTVMEVFDLTVGSTDGGS